MSTAIIVNTLAPIFYKLLYMSMTALVIGVVLLIIRKFFDRQISPFWKKIMWVLVLVALTIPYRPQSKMTVMQNSDIVQNISFKEEYANTKEEYYVIQKIEYPTFEQTEQLPVLQEKTNSLYIKTLIFDTVIPLTWLCGVILTGIFMLISNLKLSKVVKKYSDNKKSEELQDILQLCKEELKIKIKVRLIVQNYVKTPALYGFFRPKILLPQYVCEMNEEKIKYILLHELSHLKRLDNLLNTILLLLRAVYWFNPFVCFLFKFIREDIELANDFYLLKNMDSQKQKEYSYTLVEVLKNYNKTIITPRLLCMVDDKKT